MIVCVCNNVSDKKIRQAVDAGMRSMAELRENLDVGTCCGKCRSCAKRVLNDCLQQSPQATPHHLPAMPLTFQRTSVPV